MFLGVDAIVVNRKNACGLTPVVSKVSSGALEFMPIYSVKFVSKRILWSARFGEDYVHWELVEGLGNKNICGGCAEWIGLLSFCKWDDLSKQESTIQSAHQPLQVRELQLVS